MDFATCFVLFNFVNVYGSAITNEEKEDTRENVLLVVLCAIIFVLYMMCRFYRLVNMLLPPPNTSFFVLSSIPEPDEMTLIEERNQIKMFPGQYFRQVHKTVSISNQSNGTPLSSNLSTLECNRSNSYFVSDITSPSTSSGKSRTKRPIVEHNVPSFERRQQMKIRLLQTSSDEIEPKFSFYTT